MIFNVYVDNLTCKLNDSKVGFYIGTTLITQLCYADNATLISPLFKGLQNLIDICQSFGNEYNVNFNVKKKNCMLMYV